MYRNIHINRHGAAAARGAHNSEVIRSKRIAGILVLAKLIAWCRHFLNRGGAEVARGAHNSEDIGSKPISGILVFTRITTW